MIGYLEVYQDLQDDNIILTCHPPWWNKNDDGTYYFTPTLGELIPTVNYAPHAHIQECSILELETMKENKQIFGLFVALRADGHYEAFAKDWRGTRYDTFTTMEEARQWLSIGFSDSNFYPKYGGSASDSFNGKNYLEHFLFVAHYAFGTYSFFKDIVLDPLIQFGGEEPTMAMRGWTRGYRFFGIKGHILWHFNKNKNDDPEDRLATPGDPQLLTHYHKKQ